MARLGLAPFSLRDAGVPETAYRRPIETVEAAAAADLDAVGIFVVSGPGAELMPVTTDPTVRRQARERLRGLGIQAIYAECLYLEPATDLGRVEPALEAAAELGAAELLCIGRDPDRDRLVERLQELAGRCDPYGIRVNLEFFPASEVPTLPVAAAVVDRTGRTDVGVVVDTLHLHRSGGSAEDLRAVDPRLIHFAHLCDGRTPAPSRSELADDSRDRRYPGEGALPLVDYMAALPPAAPLMLECPVLADSGTPLADRARKAATAARHLLHQLPPE
jgi:sugar phosphate isomerase/epimerase